MSQDDGTVTMDATPSAVSARRATAQLLRGRDAVREAGIAVAQSARRQIAIMGQDLEPTLFADPRFVEAIRQLAIAHPAMPVRILLSDGRTFARTAFRLVGLAQRIPSRVAIRCLPEEGRDDLEAALIADQRAYLRRHQGDTESAVMELQGRREARRLQDAFERLWEQSDPAIEFRRLGL
jgi:hypothetical protein